MRPVELALQLIELLSLNQPAGVAELARLADVPKSTAQRTLRALEKAGWVEMLDPKHAAWSLSARAVVTGSRLTQDQANLRNLAIPVMEELRRATEETVYLTYLYKRSIFFLERLDGIKPVRHFFAYGERTALHATASGQAILAAMSPEALDAYLDRPLTSFTRATVTDAGLLRQELAAARERGYALTQGGNVLDAHAIAAAIRGADGAPVAALAVSMPGERATDAVIAEFGPRVADAARRLSLSAPGLAATTRGA
ncbi:IclR family transcriptional regulator [Phenylobacterium sp.]|uniref:IclR family transcriptional regulator n=1 Tax=Phenylobacterium sp. TaxID=1871053 RepID=UPI00301D5214